MVADWQSDFSYAYLRRILRAIESNFTSCLIREAPQAFKLMPRKRLLFLRHDVDIDPKRAMNMAEIENEFGIRGTYMFMVNSRLYSLEDFSVRPLFDRLISMGHEVALHFDLGTHDRGNNKPMLASLEREVTSDCHRLEAITNTPVRSISFHRPLPQFLGGPLHVAGRVNAYARELMVRYLSDSRGMWREGEPLPKLLKPDAAVLQLLIHPIWWGDKHMSPEARLEAFFQGAVHGLSAEQTKAFDDSLGGTLGIRRSGAECQQSNHA